MSPLASAALALALVHLVACGPSTEATPAATPEAAPAEQPASASPPKPQDATMPTFSTNTGKVRDDGDKSGLIPLTRGPRPAPEPPLTQEEQDLIATDPATLTPELRRKRGHALRRKILQDPDSPAARQLEALRLASQRGEIKPQLPSQITTPPPASTPAP